ncbi:hypothetical protein GQX74_005058 [Glossina fuscipes]|nr:hypothetical protein GQX74_005058 [Glossina fuscipes]
MLKFPQKVQSLEFSPDEAQHILTGCADGRVRLFDCRDNQSVNSSFVKWKIVNEVEKVLWNPNSNNYFVVGDNAGYLHYADKHVLGRQDYIRERDSLDYFATSTNFSVRPEKTEDDRGNGLPGGG